MITKILSFICLPILAQKARTDKLIRNFVNNILDRQQPKEYIEPELVQMCDNRGECHMVRDVIAYSMYSRRASLASFKRMDRRPMNYKIAVNELKEVFHDLDSNKDGRLSVREVYESRLNYFRGICNQGKHTKVTKTLMKSHAPQE